MKTCMKVVGVIAVWALALSVRAQENAWQYKVTPYIWTMGVKGDVGKGNASVPVDVDFLDAIKNLDLAGMLALEAHNGTWGVLADGSYLNLDDDKDTQLGTIRTEVEQWILEGAAIYRIPQQNEGLVLDVGLGGRYINTDIDVNVPSDDRADLNASEGWADPILVVRIQVPFAENCFGMLMGDIGGFGVESDLTWQITAATGYSFNEDVSMLIGYRYLDYDYDKNDLSYDAATSGLALGLTFKI